MLLAVWLSFNLVFTEVSFIRGVAILILAYLWIVSFLIIPAVNIKSMRYCALFAVFMSYAMPISGSLLFEKYSIQNFYFSLVFGSLFSFFAIRGIYRDSVLEATSKSKLSEY